MAGKEKKDNKRTSRVLMYFYVFFLALSGVIGVTIYRIQHSWEPDPEYIREFLPQNSLQKTQPRRGTIIDHNGKLLAISTPIYDIYMDCCVLKSHYDKDEKNGDELENKWLQKADRLSAGLARILTEYPDRDSAYYSNLIRTSRRNGHRNVLIAKGVDHVRFEEMKTLPLFKEPSNRGGLKETERELRLYPYEGLVRRVIGYVNPNNPNGYVGIEGAYDHVLRGKEGYAWARKTDKFAWISNIDSVAVEVQDGKDVRTTIDINIQETTERALRVHIDTVRHINSACAVVMDVETGAVRAMVNLKRGDDGKMVESFNFAAGHPGEPGSIFKTVILTTLIEDGLVNLDDEMEVKIDSMKYPGFDKPEYDNAAFNYIKRHGCTHIPVIDGLMVSSNYVFRRQSVNNYLKKPEELVTRLHSYNLGADFNFELTENGSGKSSIPDPGGPDWNGSTISAMGIGYAVKVTPLQILSFYNALANGGKMMQPYIVESIEMDGETVEVIDPKVLNIICSKATADTVTRALRKVTESYPEGTASRSMRGVKCSVAGKTGTAQIVLDAADNPARPGGYLTVDDKARYQASFAGFFPAENPKYSAIVTVYTDLMSTVRYEGGGGRPARVFRDIVNEICTYDSDWMTGIEVSGEMPQITKRERPDTLAGGVPDLKGLGLKDAIYRAEKAGYRCEYTGIGHVTKQETSGKTIKITLK